MSTIKRRLRRSVKSVGDAAVGWIAVGLLRFLRLFDPDALTNAGGRFMRTIGPLFRENRIAREQLAAAFPEKSPAEIETIVRGVWDNLGRMGSEFAHLDRLWDWDPDYPNRPSRIDLGDADAERFRTLLRDDRPALIFAAHLANWELPAIAAATYKMDTAVLYRRPNIPRLNAWIGETRNALMGEMISTGLDAPLKLSQALARGAHVGILVDQYYVRGVEVTFFGQKTRANPLIARLAQHFDCPIHGTRIIRLPGNRFHGELTPEVKPVRSPDGKVDIAATMQKIMTVIEGWVREHPEQWLWLHRRWRPEDDAR
jgi:KDO2-lipid IV(A) lauroyltransferase